MGGGGWLNNVLFRAPYRSKVNLSKFQIKTLSIYHKLRQYTGKFILLKQCYCCADTAFFPQSFASHGVNCPPPKKNKILLGLKGLLISQNQVRKMGKPLDKGNFFFILFFLFLIWGRKILYIVD